MKSYLSKVEDLILQNYKEVNTSPMEEFTISYDGLDKIQSSENNPQKFIDDGISNFGVSKYRRMKIKDDNKIQNKISKRNYFGINDKKDVRFFVKQINNKFNLNID